MDTQRGGRTMTATAMRDAPDVAGFELFVNGLVHDVRGTLGTMGAMARLARTRSESGDTAGASELLVRLDGVVRRANDLCNDVLECSRRRGRPTVEPGWIELVDLATVVRESLADHEGILHQALCAASLSAPAAAPVRTHRRSVDRVLANLIQNAAHYGARRPLDVCLEPAPRGYVVIVRDHGAGIPEGPLARLVQGRTDEARPADPCFERFGLGLWIAQTLVQSLGGWLHVASRMGQGTAVSFFLPAAPRISTEPR